MTTENTTQNFKLLVDGWLEITLQDLIKVNTSKDVEPLTDDDFDSIKNLKENEKTVVETYGGGITIERTP